MMTSAAALQKFKTKKRYWYGWKMTSQNSGDEYSSLPSDTKSEADSVDGLDQSKSKVSNKPQQNFNQFGS